MSTNTPAENVTEYVVSVDKAYRDAYGYYDEEHSNFDSVIDSVNWLFDQGRRSPDRVYVQIRENGVCVSLLTYNWGSDEPQIRDW